MIVELLRNLKVDRGRVMVRGRYSDKNTPFPSKLYEEIRMGRTKNVKVVRYEPHDQKSQSSEEQQPSQADVQPTTTLDEGAADTLTTDEVAEEKTDTTKKKGARKPRTTSTRKKS